MILIGDIGASKTLLALGELRVAGWHSLHSGRYADDGYGDFGALLRDFLDDYAPDARARGTISSVYFGVAGPVTGSAAHLSNRGWSIDARKLAAEFGLPLPRLMNDVVVAAYGLPLLRSTDVITLQPGEPVRNAPHAVLSVGTGYNAAYLVHDGNRYQALGGEAGHAAFAPVTPEAIALWQALVHERGGVAIEDVISGRGIVNIYAHLQGAGTAHIARSYSDAVTIVAAAEDGDGAAAQALDLFVDCFGRLASDQALSLTPRGGLYLGGGIPARVLRGERRAAFMRAFESNKKFTATTAAVPIHLVVREDLVLLGCQQRAGAMP